MDVFALVPFQVVFADVMRQELDKVNGFAAITYNRVENEIREVFRSLCELLAVDKARMECDQKGGKEETSSLISVAEESQEVPASIRTSPFAAAFTVSSGDTTDQSVVIDTQPASPSGIHRASTSPGGSHTPVSRSSRSLHCKASGSCVYVLCKYPPFIICLHLFHCLIPSQIPLEACLPSRALRLCVLRPSSLSCLCRLPNTKFGEKSD